MIVQCYLHSIYILPSFTGFEDDIFQVISNWHIQRLYIFLRTEPIIWEIGEKKFYTAGPVVLAFSTLIGHPKCLAPLPYSYNNEDQD